MLLDVGESLESGSQDFNKPVYGTSISKPRQPYRSLWVGCPDLNGHPEGCPNVSSRHFGKAIVGALIIRIGFGAHYTIIIVIRNPPKIVLVIILGPLCTEFCCTTNIDKENKRQEQQQLFCTTIRPTVFVT